MRYVNEVLLMKELYKEDIFLKVDQKASELLNKGVDQLSKMELYNLNKHVLKSALGGAVEEVSKWGRQMERIL